MNCKGLAAVFFLFFSVIFLSCTKINEATDLGGGLIPAVDNITTFDTTLAVTTGYYPFDDSTVQTINSQYNDFLALGKLSDPVFGSTTADMYFNLGSTAGYGVNPFYNKDSVKGIDSVVLSLSYQGGYGDTANSIIGVQVFELAANNNFKDDSSYRFDVGGFTTTGPSIGSRNFVLTGLKDSVRIIRKNDTTKVANVLRIRLNNSIGDKLRTFDTVSTNLTSGGFNNDSLFRSLFHGLAIKTTSASGGGALAYFNLIDAANTRLIVYYRVQKNGVIDSTASASFTHIRKGQANAIQRVPSGAYLADLNKPAPQRLYLQSSPTGSYISMKIPALDVFPNRVIHRAELIAYKVDAPSNDLFPAPSRLILDHKGPYNIKDSAYTFDNDLQVGSDGSLNFASFGGSLKIDNSYRFNITRYIQNLVTRRERNDSLRLYAPLRTSQFVRSLNGSISISNLSAIGLGRVVLASGNYTDPALRLRLHIVYSNL